MMDYELGWDEYKKLFGINMYGRYIETDTEYILSIEWDGINYRCNISKDDESGVLDDFISNYKNLMNVNANLVNQSFGYPLMKPIWRQYRMVINAGSRVFFDVRMQSCKLISGGYIIRNLSDVSDDDVVEISVIDKDNVLGLFDEYDIPDDGTGFLELWKFLYNWHPLLGNGGEYFSDNIGGVFSLKDGLYVRFDYASNGSNDIKIDYVLNYYL